MQPFPRTQSRAFPIPRLFIARLEISATVTSYLRYANQRCCCCIKKLVCYKPPGAKRRTQYFLLSDLPHRWSYFDYDQGPLSCVHLPVFVNSVAAAPAPGAALAISFFIIAPQKNGVNPKARFCKDFYRKARNQCNIQTAYLRYAIQRCCRCIKKLNCNAASYRNKTPFSVLRRTEKGVLLGYCLGVRRNHVTWEVVAAPLPMAKV